MAFARIDYRQHLVAIDKAAEISRRHLPPAAWANPFFWAWRHFVSKINDLPHRGNDLAWGGPAAGRQRASDKMQNDLAIMGLRQSANDEKGSVLSSILVRNVGVRLRSMDVRSRLAGGTFSIGKSQNGGVQVLCLMPETADA
jgi:hypothetical protein